MLSSLFIVASLALLFQPSFIVAENTGVAQATSQATVQTGEELNAQQVFNIFLAELTSKGGTIPYVNQAPCFLVPVSTGSTNKKCSSTCNPIDPGSKVNAFKNGVPEYGFNNGVIVFNNCELQATIKLTDAIKTAGSFFFSTTQAVPVKIADTFALDVNGITEASFNTENLPSSPQDSFSSPSEPNASGNQQYVATLPQGTDTIRIVLNSNWFVQTSGGNDQPSNVAISPLRVTSALVVGDPQFTGFLNQHFQVHGSSDMVYNVISSKNFQYNALFKFLSEGKCRHGTPCFSHPGNYFGEVGMVIRNEENGNKTEIRVTAGDVETGLSMEVNREEASVGDEVKIGGYTVKFLSQFEISVGSSDFDFVLQNSDMFINQMVSLGPNMMSKISQYKLAVKTGANTESALLQLPHGLLGQTWEFATYDNRWKYIAGNLFDYIQSEGIFGTSGPYNKFQN
jgi:hypothetical protein